MINLSNLIIVTTAISCLVFTSLPFTTSSFIIKSQVTFIDSNTNSNTNNKGRRNCNDYYSNTNFHYLSSSGGGGDYVRLQMSSTSSNTPQWTDTFGSSALKQVQNLASVVSAANEDGAMGSNDPSSTITTTTATTISQEGNGTTSSKNNMSGDTDALFSNLTEQRGIKGQNRKVVLSALESLERDSKFYTLYFQCMNQNDIFY